MLTQITFFAEGAVLYQLVTAVVISHSLTAAMKPLSKQVLATLILLSILVAALTPEASQSTIRLVLQRLSLVQDVVEVGLLLALFLFTRILAISWKSLPAGVALGLGISSSTDIAAMIAMSRFGKSAYVIADTVHMAGFEVCVMVWVWFVLRPESSMTDAFCQREIANLGAHAEEVQAVVASRAGQPFRGNHSAGTQLGLASPHSGDPK